MARVLHPVSSRRETLPVFIAYLDESGGPDQSVFTVAGFVATEKAWSRFVAEWKKVLSEFGVQALHMTDFENRRGEFANDWSDEKRIEFISALAWIVTDTVELGVSSSVLLRDFENVFFATKRGRGTMRAAYRLSFQTCLEEIATHIPPAKGELIPCVCEENNSVRGVAVERHFIALKQSRGWREIFGTISFAPKRNRIPLQSADMLAYETFKHVTNQYVSGPLRPSRKLIQALGQSQRLALGYFNREVFLQFSESERRRILRGLTRDSYD